MKNNIKKIFPILLSSILFWIIQNAILNYDPIIYQFNPIYLIIGIAIYLALLIFTSKKIIPKMETVSDTVPYNENRRTNKQQNSNCFDQPADEMCAAKALLFIRNRSQILFRRRAEKALVLNESHCAVQNQKVCRHHQKNCKNRDFHSVSLLIEFSGRNRSGHRLGPAFLCGAREASGAFRHR